VKKQIFKIFKGLTPPLLISLIKKSGLSLNNSQRVIKPAWHVITGGVLSGKEIFIDPIGDWQQEIINGTYDGFIFDYLQAVDLENKTIFDVGTHIGYHSLCFAQLAGESGRVVSFEPNMFNIERIRLNLEKNPELSRRVKLIEKAISDKIGSEEFIFSDKVDKGSSSGSFLSNADTFFQKDIYEKSFGFKKVDVQTITLDEFSRTSGLMPDLIKLDVEGAEYLALEGANNVLSQKKPIVLIEVHSIFNMYKVFEILNQNHYKIEFLKEEKDGRCFIAAK
jgi:FkbM family methyltransferase